MTRIMKIKKRRNSIEPEYKKKLNNLIENSNANVKHKQDQHSNSTNVKQRRLSVEENAKKVKHKIKKEKKKIKKREKNKKQARKVIEKLKELKETKKKAKWEARKGQIKKACKLGISIGLIAIEIALLCI